MRMFLLTGFGLGTIRHAPGTWGSLLTVIVVAALLALNASLFTINITLVALIVVYSAMCIAWVPWAEQKLGQKDPGSIVADEVAGVALTLLFLPWYIGSDAPNDWLWNAVLLIVGFALFRFFDITKLPPVRQAEQLPDGWGLLSDDLVAALYALIGVQLVARLLLPAVWST